MHKTGNFLQDEEGAAAMEYALLTSLIAMVIIFAIGALGNRLCGIFSNIAGMLGGAASNGNVPCS